MIASSPTMGYCDAIATPCFPGVPRKKLNKLVKAFTLNNRDVSSSKNVDVLIALLNYDNEMHNVA